MSSDREVANKRGWRLSALSGKGQPLYRRKSELGASETRKGETGNGSGMGAGADGGTRARMINGTDTNGAFVARVECCHECPPPSLPSRIKAGRSDP